MRYISFIISSLLLPKHQHRMSAQKSTLKDLYRSDGVKINYDPYSPEMMEKYGQPGETDNEGFNPYADTVGPGIYGGCVKRDENGNIVIGKQYQNHNPTPGPVYAGGGYAPIIRALHQGKEALTALLDKYPDLVNDITTGGATPLHMCGMSKQGQMMTELLIERGGNVHALDTYGYTPLHRMASNNLAIGARALVKAGADPFEKGPNKESPWETSRSARAYDVTFLFRDFQEKGTL